MNYYIFLKNFSTRHQIIFNIFLILFDSQYFSIMLQYFVEVLQIL